MNRTYTTSDPAVQEVARQMTNLWYGFADETTVLQAPLPGVNAEEFYRLSTKPALEVERMEVPTERMKKAHKAYVVARAMVAYGGWSGREIRDFIVRVGICKESVAGHAVVAAVAFK